MQSDQPLFSRFDFPGNVRMAPERLAEAVERLPDGELLKGTVEELAERLVREHMYEMPGLDVDKTRQAEGEVEVDVSRDPRRAGFGRGPLIIKATEYRFYIPFRGPAEMFEAKPSTFGGRRPRAHVDRGEVVIRILNTDSSLDAAGI